MKIRLSSTIAALLLLLCVSAGGGSARASSLQVTRATLPNGLKIVVVRDPLAPVVTTMLNYKIGSDDQTIAGLAHATEHMMFRGSKTLSSSQLMDSIDITGGNFDADTQNEVTQYFFTVPSQYLGIALHLERSRATGLEMAQKQWDQERGAITQEVTQDNSNAFYRLQVKMQDALLGGTPYAKNGLGTVYDFAHKINHPQLINFYNEWYHPNNAVYVIVGDVNGPQTIARVRKLFSNIPAKKLPPRDPVVLHPVHARIFHDTTDQPFTVVMLGYRLPGFDSKDYAAANILADVLNSQRGDLYGLAAAGKILGAQFQLQGYPKASVGMGFVIVPVSMNPAAADKLARGVIANYRKNGVPQSLVRASVRREIAQLEYNANSIEGLAFEWSQAVAVQGLNSPDDMIAAYKKVTAADVDRLLRTDLTDAKTVAAYAVPKNLGKVQAGSGAMAQENNSIPPSKHQPLPSWAQRVLTHLRVPSETIAPVSSMLPNGIHLIVVPDHSTGTVTVNGQIRSNPQVEEPPSQLGVASMTNQLFTYGSTDRNRIAFQSALDRIAANEQAGTSFSVQTLSADFGRGVALLADNELHPRFGSKDFAIVKQQMIGSLTGAVHAPDHLAQEAMAKALYPAGDPMTRFATPATAQSVTLDDVKKWYATAYRPDLTTIVVVGDVTPANAKATVERYFGGWKAIGPKPPTEPPAVPLNKPSAAVIPANGRVQSTVELVETTGLLRTNPSWATMAVANAILSGGFYSSLLYHDLREVHGYVYYVGSQLNAGKTRSTFGVTYASDPKNIVPAEELAIADLERMQKSPIAAGRLLRAKAQLMGQVPLAEDSYDGVASILQRYASFGMPLNENLIDANRELHVTASQLEAAMRKWVRPNGFVRIVTGPGPT